MEFTAVTIRVMYFVVQQKADYMNSSPLTFRPLSQANCAKGDI